MPLDQRTACKIIELFDLFFAHPAEKRDPHDTVIFLDCVLDVGFLVDLFLVDHCPTFTFFRFYFARSDVIVLDDRLIVYLFVHF